MVEFVTLPNGTVRPVEDTTIGGAKMVDGVAWAPSMLAPAPIIFKKGTVICRTGFGTKGRLATVLEDCTTNHILTIVWDPRVPFDGRRPEDGSGYFHANYFRVATEDDIREFEAKIPKPLLFKKGDVIVRYRSGPLQGYLATVMEDCDNEYGMVIEWDKRVPPGDINGNYKPGKGSYWAENYRVATEEDIKAFDLRFPKLAFKKGDLLVRLGSCLEGHLATVKENCPENGRLELDWDMRVPSAPGHRQNCHGPRYFQLATPEDIKKYEARILVSITNADHQGKTIDHEGAVCRILDPVAAEWIHKGRNDFTKRLWIVNPQTGWVMGLQKEHIKAETVR